MNESILRVVVGMCWVDGECLRPIGGMLQNAQSRLAGEPLGID